MKNEEGAVLTSVCMCVSAKGPVFSSGHDLKELTSSQGREYHTKVFHTCAEVSFSRSLCFSVTTTKSRGIGLPLDCLFSLKVKKPNVFSLKSIRGKQLRLYS